MKYCNPFPFNIVSVSCLFKPVSEFNTNGNTIFQKIISIVCRQCEVTRAGLRSKSREIELVEARYMAVYFTHTYSEIKTLKAIGRYFNRDHSSIIYALNNLHRFKRVDKAFKARFELIEKEILQAITN